MSSISVITSPWTTTFETLLSDSKTLEFASPFITQYGVEPILRKNLDIRGITFLQPERFVRGASDIDAVQKLIEKGATMRSLARLHAKIYIFDNSAIVTSANLTSGGLSHNREYGLLVTEEQFVDKIRTDFANMFKNSTPISTDSIKFIERIIEMTPQPTRELYTKISEERVISSDIVLESLSGWDRLIFRTVVSFPDTEFVLQDLYDHENEYSEQYPDNQHIREKIRQVLQHLRDYGLIAFLEPGKYKLLT